MLVVCFFFFFSSRRRHTRWTGDWSSDVCSSDLGVHREHTDRRPARGGEANDERAAMLKMLSPRLSSWVEEPLDLADRKSTRLNSSHPSISYAVFCFNNKNCYIFGFIRFRFVVYY